MADNQKEKPSPEQENQRKEINRRIKKATGRGITELVEEKWSSNKGKYYDNVIKMPLPLDFVDLIKETFNVDLTEFSRLKEDVGLNTLSREYLLAENDRLHKMVEQLLLKENKSLEEGHSDKSEIIRLMKEINLLNEKLQKKQA